MLIRQDVAFAAVSAAGKMRAGEAAAAVIRVIFRSARERRQARSRTNADTSPPIILMTMSPARPPTPTADCRRHPSPPPSAHRWRKRRF